MNTHPDFSMLWHAPGGVFQQHEQLKTGSTAVRRVSSRGARMLRAGLLCLLVLVAGAPFRAAVGQTTVNLAQVPLLALKSAPGLVMLTMSRDHRLFYAAYNDTSDIDGDGVVDVGFKPGITYYGNFVSDRCYDYISNGASSLYRPVAMAASTGCKVGGAQRWHGNWLNWATTSRMDALRRVLYGGYRVLDNTTTSSTTFTSTVLQGAFIPKDSHVWGKDYRPDRDSYDITQYTPLPAPSSATTHHLFVVVSPNGNLTYPFLSSSTAPVLRYITNADLVKERIWMWASADVAQGIGSNPANFVKGGGRTSVLATDQTLRVEACVPIGGVREAGCTGYPSSSPTVWKPTGTLHDYSINDQLKFGLITGSYQNNYSGGVLRRNIASFSQEINPATGQFVTTSDGYIGIARTIDRITINGWTGSGPGAIYDCGYKTTSNRNEGECKSWGAPIGEMMYEGLRYLSGKSASTPVYSNGVASSTSADTLMGFSAPPAWLNPYRPKASGGNPICSRPVQMVIADPLTSFDSDQLPGSYFSTPTPGFGTALGSNDLTGMNVSTDASAIWTAEGLGTRNIFIGQSGGLFDGNPTAKPASSFAQIRGHAPDETQSQGSYYSAAVASFGRSSFVPSSSPLNMVVGPNPGTPSDPANVRAKVDTLAVALGSLTPKIEFPNPSGGKVSIVPLSKAIYPANINPGQYQATGAITGFYYKDFTPTSVTAIVTFSDSDQGTDNETDAQVQYDISLSGSNVTVKLTQLDPSPGGIQSNSGYVISGTTNDGLYLDSRSLRYSGDTGDVYYLDTLPGQSPKSATSPLNSTRLPTFGTTTSRVFSLSSTPSAVASFIPHDPLWYAAKYGGAGVLDAKGDPTNYFKISNPAALPAQMGKAFRSAAALAAVASTSLAAARSAGSAAIYQANYDSLTWTSRLYAFPLGTNGNVSNTPIWEASALIPVPASRNKLFLGRGGTNAPFALTSAGFSSLTSTATPTAANPNAEQTDFGNAATYAYLLGDKSGEERKGGTLRNRGTTAGAESGSVLGDIVNSDPQVIAKKDYGYAASDASYSTFANSINFEVLAAGSNDGFFHVFDAKPDATGGGELLGFMPQAARTNIKDLSAPGYQHRNFVDGSIGLGHAKIAVPGDATLSWRSVAVVAGGDGAQTVFAVNTSSKTYTANSILWEVNQASSGVGTTLGNVMGRPAIGKLADGTWVAIFGNGYNSADGTANLYVVRLTDGVILKVIPTNNAMTGNGLGSTVIVRKTSGNQDTIEFVYGADYKGHIWRFDLSNSSMSSWPATGALIYSTPTGRPITADIQVTPAPASPLTAGGKMIFFGTGSYLSAADPATTAVQALYGIYDNLVYTPNTAPFAADTDLSSMTITMTAGSDVRTTSAAASPNWFTVAGKKGWVVLLTGSNVVAGERVIAPPVRYTVAGLVDAFLFTSIVPGTDECVAGLDTWITGIDAMTGGYKKVFNSIAANSVRIRGGSPRGVFVQQDGGPPSVYIAQTVLPGTPAGTSFDTDSGGELTVNINGTGGTTRIIKIKLVTATTPILSNRQVWRQLK